MFNSNGARMFFQYVITEDKSRSVVSWKIISRERSATVLFLDFLKNCEPVLRSKKNKNKGEKERND